MRKKWNGNEGTSQREIKDKSFWWTEQLAERPEGRSGLSTFKRQCSQAEREKGGDVSHESQGVSDIQAPVRCLIIS